MSCADRHAFALLSLLACILPGCATEPGGSIAGAWQFQASWVGGCSITGSTLTLRATAAGWIGTLNGGQAECTGIPGESEVPAIPADEVLESIRINDGSVSFELGGGAAVYRGSYTSERMEGTLQVSGPFCQCTDATRTGTWSATR